MAMKKLFQGKAEPPKDPRGLERRCNRPDDLSTSASLAPLKCTPFLRQLVSLDL